ncbi:hypothetical protein HNQ94_001015 [Salirhabdus euzebyi]|uniref:NERD domain-containing protein n=1 Tax=Salirhabdus euzebyi TaxID=394506 RepID=A0A841PUT6_9BACI|nr:NERD domain-containing protein [Salirhabdus euzebyi]MBB6452570.1 hypothetical protein [Salirhabdus euzebyi]
MFEYYLFLSIVIVIGIIFGLPTVKGRIGEAKVSFLLKRLDPEEYTVVNDLLIKTADNKTAQIDHVVISRYGIFVIETKNYKGWIFGSERSKYWTQTIYKSKEKFFNPIWQNYGHIKAIENALSNTYTGPYYSFIVFSSKSTLKKLDIQSDNVEVMYTLHLLKTIKKYNQPIMNTQQVKSILAKLINLNIDDKKEMKNHVKEIRETGKRVKDSVKANVCPKCGGSLVKRKGKYGFFTGCTNFPKCRFIVKKAN